MGGLQLPVSFKNNQKGCLLAAVVAGNPFGYDDIYEEVLFCL